MSQTPPPAPPRPRALPVTASDLLLILIVSLGAVRLAAGLVAGLLRPLDGAADHANENVLAVTVGLIVFQATVMLLAIYVIVLRRYGLAWADLGLVPADRLWYRRAVAAAILLLPAIMLVNALLPQVADEPFENPQLYAIAPAGFSWTGLILMTVMAGVVAPFVEEVAFRGLLYRWLRTRLGVPAAAAASGLLFALLHGVILLIPALTVIGIVLALLYERSGSLWPAVITHGVFNTIMIWALYAALAAGLNLP
jgi:membrane protease YdiL (CAAX protease family)